MAGATGARQTRHKTHDLHVQIRIGDRHRNLIVASTCAEDAERIYENRVTGAGEAARNPDHIRLRHSDVDKSIGNSVAKNISLSLAGQIRPKAQNFRPSVR